MFKWYQVLPTILKIKKIYQNGFNETVIFLLFYLNEVHILS